MRLTKILGVLAAFFLLAIPAYAQEYGTPAEAKAMLEKAVAALKVDQAKALQMFTKGEGGFREKDLYPYCGGPDGMVTAHPTLMGTSLKGLMDKATPPKPVGQELYAAAQPGKISEVAYTWTRANSTEPVQKVAYVTKVGDQVCAVGYYKQ
jgi:signal transduction histidine kinase